MNFKNLRYFYHFFLALFFLGSGLGVLLLIVVGLPKNAYSLGCVGFVVFNFLTALLTLSSLKPFSTHKNFFKAS
jgi:hypothetical protein